MPEHFLISRTDAIGDVILTLPVAAALKRKYPDCKITWIGKTYTQPVLEAAVHVDAFLNYDEWKAADPATQIQTLKSLQASAIIHVFPCKPLAFAAKKSGIPLRIGTSHRIYHWITCNKLLSLGRKNSLLHEAQLNLQLCAPLGISSKPLSAFTTDDLQIKPVHPAPAKALSLIDPSKKQIILHPCSQGSAREWSLPHFQQLIQLLSPDKFQIFVTGTVADGEKLKSFFATTDKNVINMTGQLSLAELISFYACCTGIVAASTGPLHICAALGKYALGLYPPIRPMHPGRWAPLGEKAGFLCIEKDCNSCRKDPAHCECMQLIEPSMVAKQVQSWQ